MVVLVASLMATGAACGAPKTKVDVPARALASPADVGALTPKTRKARVPRAVKEFPTTVFSPAQAITEAANTEGGAKGVFEFKVASVGGNGGKGKSVYLNSEADYHDARNISVMVRPAAVTGLEQTLGGPLDKTLAGKKVSVIGTAHPVKTNIYDADHKKTGETFTQTRIILAKAEKLAVK
jgi:hypothetical protein